jgi:hypothetical protein
MLRTYGTDRAADGIAREWSPATFRQGPGRNQLHIQEMSTVSTFSIRFEGHR